jgi:predicted MFS family arabinose efflux permease
LEKLYHHKNLQLMFGVWLILVLGVSSISPVLPKLMHELDVSAYSIGLVISFFTMPGILLAPAVGILADRLGRKRILVASLLIFGVFGTACTFADDFRTLLILRFLQGVGVAPLGVLNPTIISDLYDGRERVAAMGYSTMALSIGTAVLPVVGGLLGTIGGRYPFLLCLPAIPLALLVHRFLDNPEPERSGLFREYVTSALSTIRTRRATALFLLTFLTSIILFGPFVTYLPVVLKTRFNFSPAAIGLIISASSYFTFLASSQMGRLSGSAAVKGRILRSAFTLYLLAMLAVPFVWEGLIAVVPVALFGAGMGLNAPIRISLLGALAPMDRRAAIMSVNNMVLRLGQTLSPVLMGMLVAGMGLDSVYFAGAALACAMILLVTRAVEENGDGRSTSPL